MSTLPPKPENPDHARLIAATGWWKTLPARDVALWQLTEDLLCMDFGSFRAAVEEAIGAPIFTREFTDPERLIRLIRRRESGADPA